MTEENVERENKKQQTNKQKTPTHHWYHQRSAEGKQAGFMKLPRSAEAGSFHLMRAKPVCGSVGKQPQSMWKALGLTPTPQKGLQIDIYEKLTCYSKYHLL